MGELSRKIGEQGEKIARDFFERIGWFPMSSGIEVDCTTPELHISKKAKNPRQNHGLDLLFSYLCPLMPRTRRNILISMKNSDYEQTIQKTTLVKDDFRELDIMMDCFEFSEERAKLQGEGGAETVRDHGLLIRINRDLNSHSSAAKNLELPSRQKSGNRQYFIENDRFDFVDSCMSYLQLKYSSSENTYNLQQNSLNLSGEVRVIESKLLPFQSLIGGPIVVRSKTIHSKNLIVFSVDSFNEQNLKRQIGTAMQCSQGWASEVVLVFEDYNRTKSPILESVQMQIKDRNFAKSIVCDNFEIRSRLK